MTSWVPLASGRDADVFALDAHRVLRRYRHPVDSGPEAAAMTHVGTHGFPVPGVLRAEGAEMEMDRLYGPTMLDACLNGDVTAEGAAKTLAALQGRLHALPPRSDRGPVLHMDLHPGNVVLTSGSPVVIDWTNALDGDPDLDLAVSALLLAMVADSGPSDLAAVAAAALPHYVRHAQGDPARLVDDAVALRLRDPNLSHDELSNLPKSADLVRRIQRDR
ncbi:phosphotransferase [Nocardiopsis nanhaiensis]